jgi:hypothetical protein
MDQLVYPYRLDEVELDFCVVDDGNGPFDIDLPVFCLSTVRGRNLKNMLLVTYSINIPCLRANEKCPGLWIIDSRLEV